ncbi:MAG: hypothetical protein MUC41_11500 [Syntrophobacteraceae bacterium]|nr:hypothetical protein [Syntrophobacteraceae bacterium]
MAFTVRWEYSGVSSVVRWLFLNPDHRAPLVRFFKDNISFLKTAIDENGRQWVHVITPANSHQVGFFD